MLPVLLALSLAHAGTPRADARGAERASEAAPQDFFAALRAGDAWLAVGAYGRATRAYERAAALAGGHSPLAEQGLAAVREARADRMSVGAGVAGTGWLGDPTWTAGGSLVAHADAVVHARWVAGGTGRVGGLTGSAGATPWGEVHARLGVTGPRAGLAVHVGGSFAPDAATQATPGYGPHHGQATAEIPGVGDAVFGGASARWSPWGDLYAEGSVARWDDATRGRSLAAWTLPPLAGLRLEPGGAVSHDGAALGWRAFGTVHLDGGHVSFRLGGGVGDESRPVSLGMASVWAVPGRVRGGAWLGATARAGRWAVSLDAEVAVVEPDPLGGPTRMGLLTLDCTRIGGGP